MRDVLILHGRADAAAAQRVAELLGDRTAFTCEVEASAPLGAFGQQFTLLAIWSDQAREDGLDASFASLFAAAPKRSVLVRVNGAQRPVSFVRLDAIEAFLTGAQADFASVDRALNGADMSNEARAEAQNGAAAKRAPKVRRQTRQAMSLAATVVVGIAGGALAVASDAATGAAFGNQQLQPISGLKPRLEAPPVMSMAMDTISPRVDAMFEPSRALSATPMVQARFVLVQKVAATEATLNALIPPVTVTPPPAPPIEAQPAPAPAAEGEAYPNVSPVADVDYGAATKVADASLDEMVAAPL